MPNFGRSDYDARCRRLAEAKRQVREKYPDLIEGSSGWHRAVENRRRRIL